MAAFNVKKRGKLTYFSTRGAAGALLPGYRGATDGDLKIHFAGLTGGYSAKSARAGRAGDDGSGPGDSARVPELGKLAAGCGDLRFAPGRRFPGNPRLRLPTERSEPCSTPPDSRRSRIASVGNTPRRTQIFRDKLPETACPADSRSTWSTYRTRPPRTSSTARRCCSVHCRAHHQENEPCSVGEHDQPEHNHHERPHRPRPEPSIALPPPQPPLPRYPPPRINMAHPPLSPYDIALGPVTTVAKDRRERIDRGR